VKGERKKAEGERRKEMQRPFSFRLSPFAFLLLFSGCLANYQFGARTLFPPNIETVYVPVFDSNSFRRQLGEELTEAVIKEIERRTPYKVVATPAADTALIGAIVSEQKHLLFEIPTGDPREMEFSLGVKVSWTDNRGHTIRDIPTQPVPAAAVDISATSDQVPEVGQSTATAHARAIQRLAEQIVSLMEKPW
jgi:hypothetical protein